MIGTIGLQSLAIDCIIGCHDKEREKAQTVYVDISLDVAYRSDTLEATVDYEAVGKMIQKLAIEGQFYLLETLSMTACELILAEFEKVKKVSVTVKKPNPFTGVAISFAQCQKSR